ncbi:MAG: RNA-binding S4 domain-containing protein [Alphaproteobacteria bacterium]|nr:RNA-binding S4 domain-containing protein [Alphaproteobacteria bacterium]MBV9555408.1 RNA-binding S4 domain-containing protein [Alphaproteobacteria bacterium]
MSGRDGSSPDRPSRRLDQWLWFARFAKSRSLAARLCAAGAVAVNGVAIVKSNHAVRAGDLVSLPQGPWQRTVEVLALGTRRGPASEARTLFRETAAARRTVLCAEWQPLLGDDGAE